MVTLHLVFQCEEIEGMNSIMRCLELGEKLPRSDQCGVGLISLELANPRVSDNAEDKFPRFSFHGFISGEVADMGLVDGFLPHFHR